MSESVSFSHESGPEHAAEDAVIGFQTGKFHSQAAELMHVSTSNRGKSRHGKDAGLIGSGLQVGDVTFDAPPEPRRKWSIFGGKSQEKPAQQVKTREAHDAPKPKLARGANEGPTAPHTLYYLGDILSGRMDVTLLRSSGGLERGWRYDNGSEWGMGKNKRGELGYWFVNDKGQHKHATIEQLEQWNKNYGTSGSITNTSPEVNPGPRISTSAAPIPEKRESFKPSWDDNEIVSSADEIYEGKPAVLDGGKEIGLEKTLKVFRAPNGLEIYAATDMGINYKDHNEDRIAVNPGNGFVAVVDGMGGHKNGDKAAEILADSLAKYPSDPEMAVTKAREEMRQIEWDKNHGGEPGAVFVSSRVRETANGKKVLDVVHAGDARIIIVGSSGEVRFASKDDSNVQGLVDLGVLTPDHALYYDNRSDVQNAIMGSRGYRLNKQSIELKRGDRVILGSDGIFDNLTNEEVAELAAPGFATAGEAVKLISSETGKRMVNIENIHNIEPSTHGDVRKFSDGYKSKPKRDNRALVIIDV